MTFGQSAWNYSYWMHLLFDKKVECKTIDDKNVCVVLNPAKKLEYDLNYKNVSSVGLSSCERL